VAGLIVYGLVSRGYARAARAEAASS